MSAGASHLVAGGMRKEVVKWSRKLNWPGGVLFIYLFIFILFSKVYLLRDRAQAGEGQREGETESQG